MTTVLIIEEIADSANKLQSIIRWGKEGYELLGIVPNGIVGRTVTEHQKPDIVMLSTTSHYFGGASFINSVISEDYMPQIIQLYSEEKTIITQNIPSSAHLSLSRRELTAEHLLEVLAFATTSLAKLSNADESYQPLMRQRNDALVNILDGKINYKEAKRLAEQMSLNLLCGNLSIALVYPTGNNKIVDTIALKQLRNLFWSVLRQNYGGEVFYQLPETVGVVIQGKESQNSDFSYYMFKQILHSIRQSVEFQLGLSVSFVWSEKTCNFQTISERYTQVKRLAKYRYFLPDTYILNEQYLATAANQVDIADLDIDLGELKLAINNLDRQSVSNLISKLYLERTAKSLDFAVLQYLRDKIELIFNEILSKIPPNAPIQFPKLEYTNIEQEYLNIRMLFLESIAQISAAQERHHPMVASAIQYLEQHYSADVSLESTAEAIGITGTYLSRLFRQELDTTFLFYLTNLRIRRAKQLLRDPRRKLAEIASSVGFQDEKYFCRVFKKITGQTPTDFRKS